MQRIKDKLWREIDQIADKPELSHGDLEALNQLTDALKDIMEVCEMEGSEDGYSGARHLVRAHYSREGGDGYSMRRGEYDRGGDGYSGRRDSRGRYARDGGNEEMRRHIEDAMASAGPEDREALERLLNKIR